MLTHPTIELLHGLGLYGMAKGFRALEQTSEARSLEHAEWLSGSDRPTLVAMHADLAT